VNILGPLLLVTLGPALVFMAPMMIIEARYNCKRREMAEWRRKMGRYI